MMFQSYAQVKQTSQTELTFDEWFDEQFFAECFIDQKEGLKAAWEAAQAEKHAQLKAKFDEVLERAKTLECENASLKRQLNA